MPPVACHKKINIPYYYSNDCSLFMFKPSYHVKKELKSKRVSKFQTDPTNLHPRSHQKNQESLENPIDESKSKIFPRIPFYFSSLYPYKNQLNSLKNPRVKSKPTKTHVLYQLESQMLIKLAKMIWKATKAVQNSSVDDTIFKPPQIRLS